MLSCSRFVFLTKKKHHLVPISTKKLSDYIMSKESFSSVLLCNSEFRVETFAAMVKVEGKKRKALCWFDLERKKREQ